MTLNVESVSVEAESNGVHNNAVVVFRLGDGHQSRKPTSTLTDEQHNAIAEWLDGIVAEEQA